MFNTLKNHMFWMFVRIASMRQKKKKKISNDTHIIPVKTMMSYCSRSSVVMLALSNHFDALSGDVTLSKLLCYSSEKGATPEGKTALLRRGVFPFRVNPFSERV